MTVDPQSIPQHVVDVTIPAGRDLPGDHGGDARRRVIAAALDALMDDEPVWVDAGHGRDVAVRPSDVLRAVLAR